MALTELRGHLYRHGHAGLRGPVSFMLLKKRRCPFWGESNCSIAIVLLLNMTLRVQRYYKEIVVGEMSDYNFTVTNSRT